MKLPTLKLSKNCWWKGALSTKDKYNDRKRVFFPPTVFGALPRPDRPLASAADVVEEEEKEKEEAKPYIIIYRRGGARVPITGAPCGSPPWSGIQTNRAAPADYNSAIPLGKRNKKAKQLPHGRMARRVFEFPA